MPNVDFWSVSKNKYRDVVVVGSRDLILHSNVKLVIEQQISTICSLSAKIDSSDQWCQRRILRLHYSQLVSNHEVRRRTDCIPPSEIIQSRRLKLFGHTARADVELDHHRALRAAIRGPPPAWRRPPGRMRQTWTRTIEAELRPLNIRLHTAWRRTTGPHYLEETHEDSYALPRGMLLMRMMRKIGFVNVSKINLTSLAVVYCSCIFSRNFKLKLTSCSP